jgi:hypothetical protein
MEQEIPIEWMPVPGFEQSYKVSNTGIVVAVERRVACGKNGMYSRLRKEQVMKPYIGTDGYYYFFLTYQKSSKHIALHRLLALCFIPNRENKREVNHKNTIRADNTLSNLEWATPKENIQHSIKMGTNTQCLPGTNNPAAKLTNDEVLQIRIAAGSHTAIAKKFNVSRRTIGFIKRRERWAHL